MGAPTIIISTLLTKLDIIIKDEETVQVQRLRWSRKVFQVKDLKDTHLQMHLGPLGQVEAKEHFDQFSKIELQITHVKEALEEIQIMKLLQVVFKLIKFKLKTPKCLQEVQEL